MTSTSSPAPSSVTVEPGQAAQARQRLLELIKELAIVHGKVTLSSGLEADYYVDMRRVTLHHEGSRLVGEVMADMLAEHQVKAQVVGGLTMGADPVATALMRAVTDRGAPLDACVVRKESKGHGLKRQVEGPGVENKNVLVVEDSSTTGGSPIFAVDALRNAGAHVDTVAVIVDRDSGAREAIEAKGLRYLAAFSLDDLGLR